jgi:hypothetical protein
MGTPDPHDEVDPEVEAWLRRNAPTARGEFIRKLEGDLFGSRTTAARRPAWRPAFAGAGLAGGLATAAVALSLAGVGPLAPSGEHGADANSHCRYVSERHVQRTPKVVTGPSGQPAIRYDRKVVTTQVRRCD